MKRLFALLLISFAALSCEMIDEKLNDLLGKRDWVVFAEGTELTANVPSKQTVLNYKFESALDWEVKTDAEWLEIDPMSGRAGKDIKIQIKVAKNKDKEGRTGYVDLTLSNEESYRITINQAGEGDENDENDVDIPNNQIWYTSIDGEIVEPYSGEYNGYAEAITTFGVNIVSNTYVDGKGVIEFDGDVTTIGHAAFGWCENLEAVHITDIVSWCNIDFINLFTDGRVDLSANPLCYAHNLYLNGELVTDLVIPDGVNEIKLMAFALCGSIKSVTIPNSVTTIGDYAFWGCTSLTSVTIPDSVTEVGDYAFAYCYSLQKFNGKFASEDGKCLIVDGVLNSFAIGCGATEYTIPDSVTTIGDRAFLGCSSLQEFNGKFASEDGRCLIVDGVLNSFAPAGLTEYTIPDSVTTIGDSAFRGCSLTSVTIPDSVTEIGNSAFYDCSSLTSVTIGDSVTTIGYEAFSYCPSLTSVYCKAITPPAEGYYMFHNNAYGRKIYVPMESVEAYKSAEGWSDYADDIVGYDF